MLNVFMAVFNKIECTVIDDRSTLQHAKNKKYDTR